MIVLADGRGEWHCGRIVPTVKRSLIHQDVTGLAEVDLSSCLVAFIHEHRSQQVAIADN